MFAIHHARTSHTPPNMKSSTAARSTRSAARAPHLKSGKHHKFRKHRKAEEEDEGEQPIELEDDGMATSFLQFCAMCEKQILVPNSSYLYCSEQCKRMDGLPSSKISYSYDALSTPYKMKEKYPTILDPLGLSLPRYVPALKPTPPYQTAARIPPKLHNAKPDLDPTEWKPAEPSDSDENPGGTSVNSDENIHRKGRRSNRPSTAQHHGPSLMLEDRSGHQARRALPSLSHASTATASSTSSSASSHLESQYGILSAPISGQSTSVSVTSTLGMEGLNLGVKDQLEYEKRIVTPSKRNSAASGSLKKLLAGDIGKYS